MGMASGAKDLQDAILGVFIIFPMCTSIPLGVLYQQSPPGTTRGPEVALDTTQITRWVLELPAERAEPHS